MPRLDTTELTRIAARCRLAVLRTVAGSGAGHVGGPLSMMDILVTLYFNHLDVRPDEPTWADRDRFVLSKGHAAVGYYAVLAERGFFPVEELVTFDKGDSRLQGHPDMTKTPGVDASTGSLGQGLSYAAGIALGAKRAGKTFRTWTLLGDGEIQEGQVWEAARFAHLYELDNLVAILDHNGLQQYGLPGGEGDRGDRREPWRDLDPGAIFAAFGWRVLDVAGHDIDALDQAMTEAAQATGRPTIIVARTVKGKGFSLSENSHAWHATVPSAAQVTLAEQELEGAAR